jgi:hypothetical protein
LSESNRTSPTVADYSQWRARDYFKTYYSEVVLLHSLYRCKAYKVGERMLPGADLSEDDLVAALCDTGFARSSVDVQVIPC